MSNGWHDICRIQQKQLNLRIMKKSDKYNSAVNMYKKGMSISDLAAEYGVNKSVMYRVLKRRGCAFRKGGLITEQEPICYNEYWFKHFKLGVSVRDLSVSYGVSQQTIRKRIGMMRKLTDRSDKIAEMLAAGKTRYAIAKDLGVTQSTVKYWCDRMGLGAAPANRGISVEKNIAAMKVAWGKLRRGGMSDEEIGTIVGLDSTWHD